MEHRNTITERAARVTLEAAIAITATATATLLFCESDSLAVLALSKLAAAAAGIATWRLTRAYIKAGWGKWMEDFTRED